MDEYIEREAFITRQRELYCQNCDRRKGMKNGKLKFVYAIGEVPCRACGIGDMLNSIEDYPAADVVLVRHGKWTGHDIGNGELSIDEDTCSLCGSRFYQIAETGCDWNFCPTCGARMDGEKSDNQ